MKIKKKVLAGEIATALFSKLDATGKPPKKLRKLIEKISKKLAEKVKKTAAKAAKKAKKDLAKSGEKTLPAVVAALETPVTKIE